MELCSIASGSSGNAVFVGTDSTKLLVDAGISGRRIEGGLHNIHVRPGELNGILVTHEHSDHIKGLGIMARRYGIPIYATRGTIEQLGLISGIGEIDRRLFIHVMAGKAFRIGDIDVLPFMVYHDAAEPVAYRFYSGDKSIGILTDCGMYDVNIISALKGVDALLLEANHDVHMLQAGSYPYHIKRRILSNKGHLSNECSGRLLSCLLDGRLKNVLLGHLSEKNNFAELAYETVRAEVDLSDCGYTSGDFRLSVAARDTVSDIINIS